jgi:hypothetical protein
MSIFGSIWSKIVGHSGSATAAPASATASSQSAAPSGGASKPSTPAPAPASMAPGPSEAPATIDVAAVLNGLAAKAGQKLDWKHSIVDLMKLLDLDSSLSARKELAQELHYSGDTSDSATMNIWLHKQVMQKFTQNGGKVPDDLKA